MWFKLGIFCSESPKWKWKLFQLPWLKKHVLFGLLRSSLVSPCVDWRKGDGQGCLYTPLVNTYSLFLVRTALSGVNPCAFRWLFLSLLTHFAAVGGSIWTQTWFGIYGDCSCELFICITICWRKLMHYALPFIFPPWIHYHPSPRWACREEYKHMVGCGFKFQLQPGCYAPAFQHLG